jgi:uncharacterized protein with PQ loop repeat
VNRALLTELIGWTSSLVLLATILWQVRRQWRARNTEGVSTWLFVGQFAASVGFTAYSVLLDNEVFIVTNATLALTAVIGWALLRIHRRREARAPGGMPP